MKRSRIIMGMPVTIEVIGNKNPKSAINKAFKYFEYVDNKFSTFKPESEITRFNRGKIKQGNFSPDMREVFRLSEETKLISGGYFDILINGQYDPSGLVKGWAINNAAKIIKNLGFSDFYVEAGGDIQTGGKNSSGDSWRVGIKNPFDKNQIIKVVMLNGQGIATSGNYERGFHIINPKTGHPASAIMSLTVIGPNVYEADRFATAAFAMGDTGINFIEKLPGLEGYSVNNNGTAIFTTGFERFLNSG